MPSGTLPPRATGKCGAKWNKDQTDIFLDVCTPYREELSCSAVPKEIWQHISDVLYSLDPSKLNFSHEMLREKMRLLKGYNNQKKQGKHGNSEWEFQKKMDALFHPTAQAEESKSIECCAMNVKCSSNYVIIPRFS